MSSLFIPEEVQAEFLTDIFGHRSNNGLIDSEVISSFKSPWDDRETKASRKETPQFITTTLSIQIAMEMKERTLLPVRRSAGLGNNFYCNNCL